LEFGDQVVDGDPFFVAQYVVLKDLYFLVVVAVQIGEELG
jgi:hypothetical protein